MPMKALAFLILPAIGLLILIIGPTIRLKTLKHGQKEKGVNPSKRHAPLAYSSQDKHYLVTTYSQYAGDYEPLGDTAKLKDNDG